MASSTSQESPPKRRKIVDSASIGSPPGNLTCVETVQANIYNFASLSQQRGEHVQPLRLQAHRHLWEVVVFPRGSRNSDEQLECVSLYLRCLDVKQEGEYPKKEEVKAKFSIELGSKNSIYKSAGLRTFTKEHLNQGWHNAALYDHLVGECLDDDGTFRININIQVQDKSTWYPKQVHGANLLYGTQLLESAQYSDVSFVVGTEKEYIHGHKCVLVHRAPVLHEIVENSQCTEVEILDVSTSSFKTLLSYIYTGTLPDFSKSESELAKPLLLDTNKFVGCQLLKLHIESEITAKFVTAENAADWLLIADGHVCPLLKEICMKVYKEDASTVMQSKGWTKVVESNALLQELLKFSVAKQHEDATERHKQDVKIDYDSMDVRRLRERLESLNLDLDGSREMLIKRLKEHDDTSSAVAPTVSVDSDSASLIRTWSD